MTRALLLSIARLSRNSSLLWKSLDKKTIKNENVIINGFSEIYPDFQGPIFTGRRLYLVNCNKFFVYYWLTKINFPYVKDVYMASNPCNVSVLERGFDRIHLLDTYERYHTNYSQYQSDIRIIDENALALELAKYDEEEIIFK